MKTIDHFWPEIYAAVDLRKKSILDIGCGWGYRTVKIAKFSSSKVLGIDPNLVSIKNAKKYNSKENISYKVGVGEQLKFKDNSFDVVVFTLSLHHIPNPSTGLKEAIRVVRPGGYIVIIEPGGKGTSNEAEKMFDAFDGDETREKNRAQQAIKKAKGVTQKKEFFGKTDWLCKNLEDFTEEWQPKKHLSKVQPWLEKYEYKLWGERVITILIKTSEKM